MRCDGAELLLRDGKRAVLGRVANPRYLEDTTSVCAIDVDRQELLDSLPRGTQWYGGSEPGAEEVTFVGIFDG